MELLFLTSGLFLGWSLGANNAANVFGTAVATRMVRFRTAATIAAVSVILGAVISGSGPAHTYGKLGSINALAGAFTVALAAAITLSWMTKLGLPVSTSQAIVGAIVGWDLFAGRLIDTKVLYKIIATWVICPILTGIIALLLFQLAKYVLQRAKIHILRADFYTRAGLILIGAFGSYSLGANNIANVMGVFVNANPFKDIRLLGFLTFRSHQILFFLGGILIGIGIFTYSHRVMKTVGSDLMKLSPVAALVVVLAESIVLFIFASETLERFLVRLGLPTIPLVPISSSQAVVGGVIGIAIVRGGARAINLNLLWRIIWGWVLTPLSAGVLTFFSLFFMQNVFQQEVYKPVTYRIDKKVIEKLRVEGIEDPGLLRLEGSRFNSARTLKKRLKTGTRLSGKKINRVIEISQYFPMEVSLKRLVDPTLFSRGQWEALKKIEGSHFDFKWELVDTLSKLSEEWRRRSGRGSSLYNRELSKKFNELFQAFHLQG
jgi:PiT family inorganic phosphate transporter